MNISIYPSKDGWDELLKRPLMSSDDLFPRVQALVEEIRKDGDAALRRLEERFDKAVLEDLEVSREEVNEAIALVDENLKKAIDQVEANIAVFHDAQTFRTLEVETTPGVVCSQKSVPIEKVGLYVPGGTAPLFSTVLMLAVPARIAGCKEIVLCSPPDSRGKIHPAILYAAWRAGVSRIFKLGGVQAISAMALGTQSVPKVFKIFGPGNQYVMAAKQVLSLKEVAIDMPAGPSEVLVLADESASARFVAADLLSQAEHGVDSQALLITTSKSLLEEVQVEVQRQLERLPRQEIAAKALQGSRLILVHDVDEAVEMANRYAPEHLIIQMRSYRDIADRIFNAGSVFLGPYSCESAGDYASGTNHTLPTNGYAKAYSGVNLDSFMRKMTLQELSAEGIMNLGRTIETMASAELLEAHRNAVSVRLAALEGVDTTPAERTFDLDRLVKKNILSLKPYSCARNEFSGAGASVFLDANENPYNAPYNRYPDPLQRALKHQISLLKGVDEERIFCGNGSDEAIDLMFRIFCESGKDNVVALDPTYGMYEVCADINGVDYRKVPLDDTFSFTADSLMEAVDANTKVVFLCSPNNPTGNSLPRKEMVSVLERFRGIVVVDEAYIDFSSEPSMTALLDTCQNLVVLQTLSKAWGMAALRLGLALTSKEIIALMNKVKYPYNVNYLTQKAALEVLMNPAKKQQWVDTLLRERTLFMEAFQMLPLCLRVYPTDANFFLARVTDADGIYAFLVDRGIIVRNRNKVSLCQGCLRITIGTPDENRALLDALKEY